MDLAYIGLFRVIAITNSLFIGADISLISQYKNISVVESASH